MSVGVPGSVVVRLIGPAHLLTEGNGLNVRAVEETDSVCTTTSGFVVGATDGVGCTRVLTCGKLLSRAIVSSAAEVDQPLFRDNVRCHVGIMVENRVAWAPASLVATVDLASIQAVLANCVLGDGVRKAVLAGEHTSIVVLRLREEAPCPRPSHDLWLKEWARRTHLIAGPGAGLHGAAGTSVNPVPGESQGGTWCTSQHPRLVVGHQALLCATPFGAFSPRTFFDAAAGGIITTVARDRGRGKGGRTNAKGKLLPDPDAVCTAFTDARSLPGTEGGAVYTRASDMDPWVLAGLALPSLVRDDGHKLQLVPVASVGSILGELARRHACARSAPLWPASQRVDKSTVADPRLASTGSCASSPPPGRPLPMTTSGPVVRRRCRTSANVSADSVVLVSAGGMWASGVLVDAARGIIITNAHVVAAAPNTSQLRVLTTSPGRHWSDVSVCFACKGVPDIAVLQLQCVVEHQCTDHRAARRYAGPWGDVAGSKVVACGYPLLEPRVARLAPSMTTGTVGCSAAGPTGGPDMLHLSTVVYPGSSGGALFLHATGELLGILTSYSQFGDEATVTVYPRLAFAVPTRVLSPLWALLGERPSSRPSSRQASPLTDEERAALGAIASSRRSVTDLWSLAPEALENTEWHPSRL